MHYVRVPWRALRIIVVTLSTSLMLLLFRPLKRLSPVRYLWARNRLFRMWARSFCRIVGMRINVEGEPPDGPFFLIANHLSYLDIPLLGRHLDGAFIAKSDIRGWPLIGLICENADTIYIDRNRKRDVLRIFESFDAARTLGLGVVLFAEGTSGKGDRILPFKTPLLEYAARRDCPVWYATISYHTPEGQPPASQAVCWWGTMGFADHLLRLFRLPHFEATLRFGAEPIHDTDRKALAGKLREALETHFIPSS